MSKSKSESLSFFNANSVPLPPTKPALFDVYLSSSGDLMLVTHDAEKTLGNLVPIAPIHVEQASLRNNVLFLEMSDGNEIELGAVERQDTYIAPELIGTGLLQKNGTFELPISASPNIIIQEQSEGFLIDILSEISAKQYKRIACSYRKDYTGQSDSSSWDNTGITLNQWYSAPGMTHIEDPDNIGAVLNAGKLVLPPGIYYVNWKLAAYRAGVIPSRLWSVTHQNTVIQGQSVFYGTTTDASVLVSCDSGYFKLIEPTTIELQVRPSSITNASMFWTAHSAIMGKIKDLYHLEIFKCPDNIGDIPEVKRVREVTRRMTSASSGNLTITANSQNAGFEAWKALDSDSLTDTTKWASVHGVAPSPSTPHWIAYAFSDGPKKVTRYGIWAPATASSIYNPKDWELQGRNSDADNWVTLDSVTNWTVNTPGSCCMRSLNNPVEYAQYRLLITGRNSGTTNGVQIGEFRLYEDY